MGREPRLMTSSGPYLGASIRRKEDHRYLTGRGRYVADIDLPHMLHVALVRSPFAHARITGIDTSVARVLPGVVAIVTAADLQGKVKPIQGEARYPGFRSPDWPILAGEVVRYQGEPVVAVVATSPYVAEDAAGLVEIDFDPLPVVIDAEDALSPDVALVYPQWGENVFLRRQVTLGD